MQIRQKGHSDLIVRNEPMFLAFSRIWTVLKATLAVGLLAVGSLYSAQIVDRIADEPKPHLSLYA